MADMVHDVVTGRLPLSPDDCYRAVRSRDARFDGWFFFGVTSTGIYCRPSCPTPVHPRRDHATFFATAAGAQRAGFRACKRCRPDATPGSPAWDLRADLVGRAMRLIADGVVDREGVGGLAVRLAVSSRHLDRVLSEEVGAGPLAIARAQRASTARILIETTDLRFADVAFAAGFASVRQFNDTVRAVFDRSPSQLRAGGGAQRGGPATATTSTLSLRLPYRAPLDGDALLGWFAARGIPALQTVEGDMLVRTMRLAGGGAVARLTVDDGFVRCVLALDDLTDLGAAVERCRRLLDLDADPVAVAADLGADPALASAVADRPGLRAPGSVDGFETVLVAIAGQQVSVASAFATIGRLVARLGEPIGDELVGSRLFPSAAVVADTDLAGLGFTARSATAVREVARLVADGLVLDPGVDRAEALAAIGAVRGVGTWTLDYVALRALRDPDVLPVGDVAIRRGAELLGLPSDPSALGEHARAWSPWRTYAAHHLWAAAARTRTEETLT